MGKLKGKRAVTQKRAKWNRRARKRIKKKQPSRAKHDATVGTTLKVGFWNVRTLTEERKANVSTLAAKKNFDILCLAETWGRADAKADQFNLKGYQSTRNEREGSSRKGGGHTVVHQG